MSDHDWAEEFTREFDQPESAVQARIWADVLGDEYPAELAPFSYTTRSELQFIADALAVGGGDVLVDIGCGRGGPGLWVAATTGACYVGIDIAASALDAVSRRAERLALSTRVRAIEGSFDSLPLDDAEADAVMSIDALLFAPDKATAAAEMARVLRPGGRLVTTTWDYHAATRWAATAGRRPSAAAGRRRSGRRGLRRDGRLGPAPASDRRTTLGQRRRACRRERRRPRHRPAGARGDGSHPRHDVPAGAHRRPAALSTPNRPSPMALESWHGHAPSSASQRCQARRSSSDV